MKDIRQSDTAVDAPVSSSDDSSETTRPTPAVRSVNGKDKPSKIKTRKSASDKKAKTGRSDDTEKPKDTNAGRSKGSKSSKGSKGSKGSKNSKRPKVSSKPKRSSRFTRKQLIVGIIIFIVLFDTAIAGILFLNNRANPPTPPLYYDDPKGVIQKQMGNNERESIYQIGYDLDLTFANYPDLTIVNTSGLKLIENDLLRSGAGPNGEDVLYDEQIVGRILRFNSSWVNYRNWNDSLVFSSVQEGSEAETKLNELGAGSMVSYQQLTLGEIRHSGKNYYILAMTSYTLIRDGRMDTQDSLFVYKLTASPQKNTMIIVDFEQIPLSALPTPPQNDTTTTPDINPADPAGEQTNEPSDGQENQTDDTQEQGDGQTNEPSTETEQESGTGDGTGTDPGTGTTTGTP